MKFNSRYFFLGAALLAAIVTTNCGQNSSPTTTSASGALAGSEFFPVNGVCPAGYYIYTDGSCQPTNGVPTAYNGTCQPGYSYVNGSTCQPGNYGQCPAGSTWSAQSDGCIAVGSTPPNYPNYYCPQSQYGQNSYNCHPAYYGHHGGFYYQNGGWNQIGL